MLSSCNLFNHGAKLKYVPYNKVLTFDLNHTSDYLLSSDSGTLDIMFSNNDTIYLNTIRLGLDTFYEKDYEMDPGAPDYDRYKNVHRGTIYSDRFLQHDSLTFSFRTPEVRNTYSRLLKAEGFPTYEAVSGVYLDSGLVHQQVAVLYQDTVSNRQPTLYAHDTVIATDQQVEGPDILCIYLKQRKRWQLRQTIMLDSVNADYGEVSKIAAMRYPSSDYAIIYISSIPDDNYLGIEENVMLILPATIKSDRTVRTYKLD
jgi:hypothetical protein